MMPLDYYGRLLRRAMARTNVEQRVAEDPFELTTPWLDEPGRAAAAPTQLSTAVDRHDTPGAIAAPAPLMPPRPLTTPPEAITTLAPRAGDLAVAQSDPLQPHESETAPLDSEIAGDSTAGLPTPSTMLVSPARLTSVDEAHAVPPLPSAPESDLRTRRLAVKPLVPPDRAAARARTYADIPYPGSTIRMQTAIDPGPATRLVPTRTRVAALPSVAGDPTPAEGVATPTVTIDHIEIEIENPAPPLPAQELHVTQRRDAGTPGDSVTASRDLWHGPTNQAFGLGQV